MELQKIKLELAEIQKVFIWLTLKNLKNIQKFLRNIKFNRQLGKKYTKYHIL